MVATLDALATPHGIDRYVEVLAPTWSSREVRARVLSATRATSDSVTLTLRTNGNWAGFRAGQYVQVSVAIEGVWHTRCYSLAGAEGSGRTLELTVKAHPHGLVSRHLVAQAVPGMVLRLSQAQGDFTLDTERPARLLLLSGGSGITPVMSMLRTLCAEGYRGSVTFVHYALRADQMIYRDELAELVAKHPQVRLVRIFTDEPGTGDLDGFLDEAQLDLAEPQWRDAEAYVCGPAPLMASARTCFEGAGRSAHLHTEAFTLASFVAEAAEVGGLVRFQATGTQLPSDGRPLLTQAEAAGLAPESGCRMGICHTCTRSLTCGTVRDAVTGELTTSGGTGVDIRICVSVPVGDVDLDL